jgi:hypothetical protein
METLTMSNPNASTAAQSALVFSQYSLCHYATDLGLVLRDLRALRRSTNHPSSVLDPVIRRVTTLRDEVREEIASIDELLDPRTADGLLASA